MGTLYPDKNGKIPTFPKTPDDKKYVEVPTSGNFDTIWLFDGTKLVPSNIESYIPDVPSSNDYDLVSIRAFLDVFGNVKIHGQLHVMRETTFDKNVILGDPSNSDDTPIFLYRGNGRTGRDEKWGGLAIGMYQDGEYGIIDYFNSDGENFGLYINENGLHVKNAAGVIETLSFGNTAIAPPVVAPPLPVDVSDFLPFSIDGQEVAPGDKFLLTTNNAQAVSPGSTPPASVSTRMERTIINSASFVATSNDLTKNIKDNWQTLTVPDTPIVLHVNEEEDTGESGHLTLDMAKSEYTAKADMVITVSARAVLRCMIDSTSSTCEWGMFAERYDVAKQAWEAIPDSHVIEPVRLVAVELEDSQTFFTIKLKTNDKLRFKHYINDPSFLVSVEASPAMNGLPARSGFLININGMVI